MTLQNETIVDRVVARLKAAPLGDLITEEDLHDIVKQAIPKAFFEKRIVPRPDKYSGATDILDPLIVEIMRDLLKESARKAVAAWLLENAQLVADHWKEVIDTGLLAYVRKIEDELATRDLRQALAPFFKEINDARSKAGLSMIVPSL